VDAHDEQLDAPPLPFPSNEEIAECVAEDRESSRLCDPGPFKGLSTHSLTDEDNSAGSLAAKIRFDQHQNFLDSDSEGVKFFFDGPCLFFRLLPIRSYFYGKSGC
jgi:hypothetical protein